MVPKLRFSFTSALSPYKLGVLTKWSSGGTPSKDNKSYWDGDISWFTAASMKDNVLSVSPTKISDLGLANGSRLANKNDILLLVRGSMLFNKIPVGVLLNDAAFNQDVKAIKCLEKFNHKFALQWFLSKESHLLSMVTGTGIGAGKLDTSELQNLDVYLPDYEEQSKIAAFLASADEKIRLLNKQYDLMCQYKKGMIQKIFCQELRFKDEHGRVFSDWDILTLGEVLDYEQPSKYIVSSTDYSRENSTPVLTAGKTFILGYTDEVHGIYNELPVIIFDDFTTDFKLVDFSFKVKSSAMKILKTKNQKNLLQYIFYAMNTINYSTGDDHKRRWISEYSNIAIPIPSLTEQEKITKFLSTIDDKIAAKKAELDHLKIWKQGLLQQMLV